MNDRDETIEFVFRVSTVVLSVLFMAIIVSSLGTFYLNTRIIDLLDTATSGIIIALGAAFLSFSLIVIYYSMNQTLEGIKDESVSESDSTEQLFNVEYALKSPENLFDSGIWEKLPERPKQDYREAIQALATGSSTASVMLALRSLEYCLIDWYEYETENEVEVISWGQILNDIRSRKEKTDIEPLLTNLDYLRTRRNEVSHLERSPDNREATATLYLVGQAISEIYSRIETGVEESDSQTADPG